MESVLPISQPFPHLLRCKRTWLAWGSNNSNDNDDWNTSKYFASLREVMADSLNSLFPHRTSVFFSIILILEGSENFGSFPSSSSAIWYLSPREEYVIMSLLTDFKVWNWLTFLFQRHFSSFTPCRLSLIYPIIWGCEWHVWYCSLVHSGSSLWQWYNTRDQVLQSTLDSHYCNQELNIHSMNMSVKNWWMSNTSSLAKKIIPKCYLSVWINAFMEH